MKIFMHTNWKYPLLALSLAFLPLAARAYVYATDIQVNGSLTGGVSAAPTPANPVAISYRLNQPATLGCTVAILNGATPVATIAGGTAMGSNCVAWGGTNQSGAPVGSGNYSIRITASATGFTNWTQISVDTNSGMAAFSPGGIDVDKNTNSPYYGRVIVSCNTTGAGSDGLYKMNADGSPADEGWYGNAGYTRDDLGDSPIAGQMPNSIGYNPLIVRIGEDDRIYWLDDSATGAIIACDMQATTNQIVIDGGTYTNAYGGVSFFRGPNNYQNCPDINDLTLNDSYGIGQFDVSAATGSNAAIYLVDQNQQSPSWGIWMFHLTNGASDPADTVGTQTIDPALASSFVLTSAGISVDDNLDIFVSQYLQSPGSLQTAFLFSNWNNGVLPPEGNGSARTYALPNSKSPTWATGGSDAGMTGINDTAINSRLHPTMMAVAMEFGASGNGGIRVLSATNGAIIATNLDPGHYYASAAFDNVSNVYGCSPTLFLWRVWSPPGANTNATLAVATVSVPAPLAITTITAAPVGGGCSTITLNFTAPPTLAPAAFTVLGASAVNGTFTPVTGATITGGAGLYQATFTSCATQFYQIAYRP